MSAYATIESPLGPLLAAVSEAGLVRLAYGRPEELLGELGAAREDPRRLDPVRRALEDYFAGRRRAFALPLDWRLAPGGFARRALEATARIPYGEVRTFGEVAAAAGNPRAGRAAGAALARNPIVIVIPCHRVLRSDGTVPEYGGGAALRLLALERA